MDLLRATVIEVDRAVYGLAERLPFADEWDEGVVREIVRIDRTLKHARKRVRAILGLRTED